MNPRFMVSAMLTLLSCLPSCAFGRTAENEPLDPAVVRSLVPGTTTAAEAVQRLGAPSQIVELGDRSAYRYDHTVTKGSAVILLVLNFGNTDSRSDRVWLFFDANDVLTHVGATFESHRPQYALPWEDLHEEGDDRSADEDRPGLRQ